MAGNDDLIARLTRREELFLGGAALVNPDGPEAATALTDRDAQIERLTRERDAAIRQVAEEGRLRGASEARAEAAERDLATLRSNYETAHANWDLTLDRAEKAERERDALRAEVERKDAAIQFAINTFDGQLQPWEASKMRAALRPNGGDDVEG